MEKTAGDGNAMSRRCQRYPVNEIDLRRMLLIEVSAYTDREARRAVRERMEGLESW
jgi:hypothetical protein